MSQALSMQRDWYPKVAGSRHTQTHTQEDGNQRTMIKMVLFFFLVLAWSLQIHSGLTTCWEKCGMGMCVGVGWTRETKDPK